MATSKINRQGEAFTARHPQEVGLAFSPTQYAHLLAEVQHDPAKCQVLALQYKRQVDQFKGK